MRISTLVTVVHFVESLRKKQVLLTNLSYMAKSFTAEAIWDVEDEELLEAAKSHLKELSERHAPAS